MTLSQPKETDNRVVTVTEGNDSKGNGFANEANDSIVIASIGIDKEKKAVGGTYKCESCGAEYTARTVWQKFCPACGQERRRQVMQAKARKSA